MTKRQKRRKSGMNMYRSYGSESYFGGRRKSGGGWLRKKHRKYTR